MALNWNAFLSDDGLNMASDRWPDNIPRTAAASDRQLTSSSARHSASLAPDPTEFSPFDTTRQDTYFTDAYYGTGSYFLSDLEVLEPLGSQIAGASTSESSPEPSTGLALQGHAVFVQPKIEPADQSTSQTPATISSLGSPATSNIPNSAISPSVSGPAYQPLFPDLPHTGYVEDVAFPDGPAGAAKPATTLQQAAAIASSPSSVAAATTTTTTASPLSAAPTSPDALEPSPNTTTKRQRGRPDQISACWTSPLCPNHGKEGPPPNPSTCGGGCVPFLFSTTEPSASLTAPVSIDAHLLMRDPHAMQHPSPEGVVEIRPKLKRSESDSSTREAGRVFPKPTAEIRPRLKSESSSQDSPENPPQPADEPKGKTRRRLPHNQVERKYRESLNTQLDSLRRVVPALQQNQRACDGGDIEDLPTPSKPSKAVVLASATAYIKQMEKEKKQLEDENTLLRARVKALQALVKCEDCSLMQYVMDLKIHNPAGG